MVAFNVNMAAATLEEIPENIEEDTKALVKSLIQYLPVQSEEPRNMCELLNELNRKNVITDQEFEFIKRELATSYNQ